MPIGVCQTCGTTVRFEGSAGLCPNCGTVLRAGQRAPKNKPPAAETAPVKKGRPKKELVDLESLDLGGEEEFAPGESSTGKGATDPVIFYLSVGAGAVLLVFGLYFALATFLSRPEKPVIPPPPISANYPPPAPPPPAVVEPPPAPPPVVVAVPIPATRPAPTTGPSWMRLTASVPVLDEEPITDKLVGTTITKAVAYVKSRFADDAITNLNLDDATAIGVNTLAVYALLHAGEAINDSDLLVSSEFVQRVLNRLKQFEMTKSLPTYLRSLRASALAKFNRVVDQDQLTKDRSWLLTSAPNGAYDYTPLPPKGSTDQWDNSNSQYGLLGVWAAAQAGVSVPDKYWVDVEQHWLSTQDKDGGWNYRNADSNPSSTPMTAAGVTSLCVTAEQQELIASKGKRDARPQLSRAIARGIDWLGDVDHLTTYNSGHQGYQLYGIERAALATGFRFFGEHDWYRELGAREIKLQREDGSWGLGDGATGTIVETSFRILFLSRGRQPLLMNKLRFAGDWNDRPRDVAKITQFVSAQVEKPFAWGVADLNRDWQSWMESPVLFITTDTAADFSDEECKKLRAYTDAGGLIFVHNEYGSAEVDAFVAGVVKRAYPEYVMTKVPTNSLLYTAVYPMKKLPVLGTVGNGIRTFLVYSPKDITQDWVRYRPKDIVKENASLQLAVNLTVVAEGKSDFRNRLDSPYEELPKFTPAGTLPVFQVTYPGAWNPEPKAYERFSRWFQKQTNLKLDVQPTSLQKLDWQKSPIALMTGTSAIDTKKLDLQGLHDFVNNGGVLFIDAAGGNAAFARSMLDDFLPRAFPGDNLSPLLPYHPIFAGGKPCMDSLPKPRLRNYASSLLTGHPADIQLINVGKGTVIFSTLDVTAGLLNSSTYAIDGYTPTYCQSLVKNVILWSLSRYHQG